LLKKIKENNLFLLIILSSIWGSAFFAIKISVESIHPISVASFRLTIAAFILLLYFLYKGYKFDYSLSVYVRIFFIALFGNFLPFSLIGWSEIYIDSNLAGLLLSISPIFALIFSHYLTTDDKFNYIKLFSILLGLIGIIFLIGIENIIFVFKGNLFLIIPKLAVIIAALGYVISSIIAYNLKKLNTISLTTTVVIFASIMSLPFMFFYELNNFIFPKIESIIAVIYLGIMPTALAYLLRFYIISRAGPVYLSYVAYLIPIFAILWGALLLDEKINLNSFIAMLFIFAGIYFGEKGSNVKNNF